METCELGWLSFKTQAGSSVSRVGVIPVKSTRLVPGRRLNIRVSHGQGFRLSRKSRY